MYVDGPQDDDAVRPWHDSEQRSHFKSSLSSLVDWRCVKSTSLGAILCRSRSEA